MIDLGGLLATAPDKTKLVEKAANTYDFLKEGFENLDETLVLYDAQAVQSIPAFVLPILEEGSKKTNFYTQIAGTSEFLDALSKDAEKRGLAFTKKDNIAISGGGATGCFSALCHTLIEKNDVVLAIAPTYILFANHVQSCGGELVLVDASWKEDKERYSVSAKDLEAKIFEQKMSGKKIKAVFVINPRNIDGEIWLKNEVDELAKVINSNNLLVIEDKVYQGTVYDESEGKVCYFGEHPLVKDQVVSIDSVSKRYGATQWRLGWILGPKEIVEKAREHLTQSVWSASEKYQKATAQMILAELGLNEHKNSMLSYFEKNISEYKKRRDLCLLVFNGKDKYEQLANERSELLSIDTLKKNYSDFIGKYSINLHEGIESYSTPVLPKATMFIPIKLDEKALEPLKSNTNFPDLLFARVLLMETGVCILPPNELTLPDNHSVFRMELGVDIEVLFKALSLMQEFCKNWKITSAIKREAIVKKSLKDLPKKYIIRDNTVNVNDKTDIEVALPINERGGKGEEYSSLRTRGTTKRCNAF